MEGVPLTEYLDPEQGSQDAPFWRISDHVNDVVIIVPLEEKKVTTKQSPDPSSVTDCVGAVWDGKFVAQGTVRVFQQVLRDKLHTVLERKGTLIARIVKPGNAYNFVPVDDSIKAAVIEEWEGQQAGEDDSEHDPF